MKVQVTTRNDDGSISFHGTLNKAEVSSLLQYSVNNLMAMGFILGQDELAEDDDETIRIQRPDGRGLN